MIMQSLLAGALFLFTNGFTDTGVQQQSQRQEESQQKGRKGWLGVSIQDLTPRLAKSLGTNVDKGAVVQEVSDDSPADLAGLEDDDIITDFGGKKIEDARDLQKAVGDTRPGSKVNVTVVRDKTQKTFAVTVGKQPTLRGIPRLPRMPMFSQSEILGLELRKLNDQLGEYFQAPDGKGVLVESVRKDSPGEKAGFKAGDVIIKAGNEAVKDAGDFIDELDNHDEGDAVSIEILRRGSKQTLSLSVERDRHRDGYWFHFEPHSFFDDPCEDLPEKEALEGIHLNMKELRNNMRGLKDKLRFEFRFPGRHPQPLHDA